jgi:hypothetical protein
MVMSHNGDALAFMTLLLAARRRGGHNQQSNRACYELRMSSNLANNHESKSTNDDFAFVCAFAALGLMMTGTAIWFGLELAALVS